MKLFKLIYSIIVWVCYLSIYLILFLPLVIIYILTRPFDRYNKIPNYVFMLIGRSILWMIPNLKVEILGVEHYNPGQSRIFIGNHQSFLDMPLLAALPWRMKWVSKDGLFKVPILGQIMAMSGHLSVKRGTTQALNSMKKLHPYLDAGIPVMMFPEGTRSRSGELLKFKGGAFMLSHDTKVPVQPILIQGTRNIIEPDSFLVQPNGRIVASILPPIYPGDYESVGKFRDDVYKIMKTELEELTKLLGE